VAGVATDEVSVRWEGWIFFAEEDTYTLRITSIDRYTLYLDGESVMNENAGDFDLILPGNIWKEFKLDYIEDNGSAQILLEWRKLNTGLFETLPSSALYHRL
jgi:hypothetical protein